MPRLLAPASLKAKHSKPVKVIRQVRGVDAEKACDLHTRTKPGLDPSLEDRTDVGARQANGLAYLVVGMRAAYLRKCRRTFDFAPETTEAALEVLVP